jgi:hypothetical protein
LTPSGLNDWAEVNLDLIFIPEDEDSMSPFSGGIDLQNYELNNQTKET